MRILVLGGAGDMGSMTVEDLAGTPGVELVTIGDRNTAAAEQVKARAAGKTARVEVRRVDALDHDDLVAAMQGHDVAASALGPFYVFEPKLIRAAIDARVNYTSICDDWVATEKVLADLDAAAREAGVIAVTGIGASPGITNLAAMYLARQLDRVDKVEVHVYQPWNAGGGEAVMRHLLFIVTGEVGAFRGGKALRMRACSEITEAEFPLYGRRRLYNLGHPEPVTLHRHIPGVRDVHFNMGLGTGMGVLVWMARRGWFQGEARVNRAVRFLLAFERWMGGGEAGLSAIRVDVYGEKDGQSAQRTLCGTGIMRDTTGLPLSVGTLALARGQVRTRQGGVYPPEAVYDPDVMIPVIAEKGIYGFEDVAMTRRIGV